MKKWVKKGAECDVYGWTDGISVGQDVIDRIYRLAACLGIKQRIAVFPNARCDGMGVKGTALLTADIVMPELAGEDYSCGVSAIRSDTKWEEITASRSLSEIKSALEAELLHPSTGGVWEEPPRDVTDTWVCQLNTDYKQLIKIESAVKGTDPINQLGTLGGSGHFVELSADFNDNVWVLIHAGSRNIGRRISGILADKARSFAKNMYSCWSDDLPGFLPHSGDSLYSKATRWMATFANYNRYLLAMAAFKVLDNFRGRSINWNFDVDCPHNWIRSEDIEGQRWNVTRNSVQRSLFNEYCIIPSHPGERTVICKGCGEIDSMNSCGFGSASEMTPVDGLLKAQRELIIPVWYLTPKITIHGEAENG